MKTAPKRKPKALFHNPDQFTPEQVGEGWRLLATGEGLKSGDQVWLPFSGWVVSSNARHGGTMDSICTYRTKRAI